MKLREVSSNKWAKKKSKQPKTLNRRLLAAPVRYCKYCHKPIPKVHGLSVKTYSIKEFCNREHYMLFHRVTRICQECGVEFESHKSKSDTHCANCVNKKAEDMKYRKKCANPTCTNLIHHKTILRFGKKKFCSLNCLIEFLGANLRRCNKCNNPLVSLNGNLNDYIKHKSHLHCEKTIFFFKKMEEIAKRTYINYKESYINDPDTTDDI